MTDTTQRKFDINDKIKIKEARYLIAIPLMVTAICLWLDLLTSYVYGNYEKETITKTVTAVVSSMTGKEDIVVNIINEGNWKNVLETGLRCAIGYLFPSLLSITVALIWQQISIKDTYALKNSKTGPVLVATVFYGLAFVSCLIAYNYITAVLFCLATAVYVIWFYCKGLDERIKPKNKIDMSEEELLGVFIEESEK